MSLKATIITNTISAKILAGASSGGGVWGTITGTLSDQEDLQDVLDTIPDELADLTEDATHRTVTDTEKITWNGKQNALGFTPENLANKGQVNGYASLGADGKVPSEQIPSTSTDFASDQNIIANQIFS